MTETMMSVGNLESGSWIYHRDYAWRIAKIIPIPRFLYDQQLVLVREDLEVKEFRKSSGTWERGRATVTSYLSVKNNEKFERCETVDERQFDWQRNEAN